MTIKKEGVRFSKSHLPSMKTLGFAVEDYPAFNSRETERHGLDVVLLTFIYRGEARHLLEDDQYTDIKGDLSITHYGQEHCLVSEDCDVYNIYVDPEHHPLPVLPEELGPTLSHLLPLHPNFYHNQNRVMRIKVFDIGGMVELLHQIKKELFNPEPGHEEMMRLFFKSFLIRLCREARPQLVEKARLSSSHPMEQIRKFLDVHFREPMNLPRLAEDYGLHPNSLSRAFKKYTACSPMEYLVKRRLQMAMLDLRAGDKKISYVALDAGFGEASLFNRLFKKHLGLTPNQYRKKFR